MVEKLIQVSNIDSNETKALNKKILSNKVLGDINVEEKAQDYIATLTRFNIIDSLNTIAFIIKRDINIYAPREVDALISTPLESDAIVRSIPQQDMSLFRLLSFVQDQEICRWLGPANPFSDYNVTDDNAVECVRYGGCRMLLCNHFSNYDGEIMARQDDDWFTGECEYCAKTVTKRSHALRIPLIGGGWYGLFCVDLRCILRALIDKFPDTYIRKAHERLLAGMLDILLTMGVYDTA